MDVTSDVQKLTSFLSELNGLRSSDPHHVITTIPPSFSFCDEISAGNNDAKKFEQCQERNYNCIARLNYFESMLQSLLEKCVREQRVVNAQIDIISRMKRKGCPTSKSIEAHTKKICQFPYFKDSEGYSHSCNEDTIKRGRFSYLNLCDIRKTTLWSTVEEEVVKNFVREEEKKKWLQTLERCGMLHMTNVEEMSLSDLVELRVVDYDWLKLSVGELKSVHTAHECKAVWINCLHPQINQTKWTVEENNELKKLAVLRNEQDWDKVALDLRTKRSSFQCVIQFYSRLDREATREWSDHEIELLKKAVSVFCFFNFIPWNKVKCFFDDRSLKEVFFKWTLLNSLGKPRTFSLEEDIVLVAGMRMFGDEISQIFQYLPDRSTRQIRERISVLMGRQFPKKQWTESEDNLLCELVEKYGFGNWLKISLHLVNRDPSTIRQRFNTLQKNAIKYGSAASCMSNTVHSPKTKLDIVNLETLWETARNICSEHGLNFTSINSLSSESRVNIVHELSAVLKPAMRNQKMIEGSKLRPILENEYSQFFLPAHSLSMNKYRMSVLDRRLIPTEVCDLVNTLRLLEVKIQLPQMNSVDNDATFSNYDKSILKYILNRKSKLLRKEKNNTFLSTLPQNFASMNRDSLSYNVDPSSYVLPLNSTNLLALRTLCLHYQNLKRQEEGLTLQVDDTEWKYARNYFCKPQSPTFGKDFSTANAFWNKRLLQILYWPYLFFYDNLNSSELFK